MKKPRIGERPCPPHFYDNSDPRIRTGYLSKQFKVVPRTHEEGSGSAATCIAPHIMQPPPVYALWREGRMRLENMSMSNMGAIICMRFSMKGGYGVLVVDRLKGKGTESMHNACVGR